MFVYTKIDLQVCCPLNAIKIGVTPTKQNESLSLPVAGNSKLNTNDNELLFTSHPNFRLLPAFENCSSNSIADRVVGGKSAPHGSYPWLVRIGYKGKSTQYGNI